MVVTSIALLIVLACFAGVLLFGAPYLPTLAPQVEAALQLANLQPGDTLLELGCGDGKVLLAAAKQGIHTVGYELNPIVAAIAWVRTYRHRKYITVIWGDFWKKSWPEAEAIFVFLLPRYMPKLHKKCIQYKYKPVKLVSFAFTIPNKQISQQAKGVYLYSYK